MAGFNVSGLPDYTDQSILDFLIAETLSNKTAAMCRPVPKVKSKIALNKLATAPVTQVGGDCAFNAAGSVTITQRTLETSPLKWQDNLCLADYEAKYLQQLLIPGQNYEGMEIPRIVLENIIAEINETFETDDWVGTVAGSAKYDGLKTILDTLSLTEANATAYLPGGGSALTSVDETNIHKVVYALQRAVRANKPALLAKNPVIALPIEWMGYLEEYYLNKNYFAWSNATTASNDDKMLPLLGFSNIKIFGTVGLSGTGTAYIMDFKKNVFLGFDKEGEENDPLLWYSKDLQTHRYSLRCRRGFQVAYPNEIFQFTLAAS